MSEKEPPEDVPIKAVEGNEDIADTPVQFLQSFLSQLKTESASVSIPESMRTLINRSLELVSGLESYPLAMSSGSSGISADAKLLAERTRDIDYEALYQEGKTGKYKYFKEMSSELLQGNILKMMVRMTGARKVLDIGTFTGFSALNMAEGLPSDGHLVTLEVNEFFTQFARDFFSHTAQKDKIDVLSGPATELLKAMGEKREQYDLIFIDATKLEYKDYLSIILERDILAPNGTMLFDNTVFKGATFMGDFPHAGFARTGPHVHDFNQVLLSDPRVEQVVLPISDGMTIVRRVGE